MGEDVDAIVQDSMEVLQQIAREGVAVDESVMLKMRLDYVTEFLVGDDPEVLAKFRLGWEQQVNSFFHEILANINKAKLLVPNAHQLSIGDALA